MAQRESQGLRVKVVDVADIYDEFSYGLVTPAALRDFLAYAYDNWMRAGRAVRPAGGRSHL